MTDRIYPIRSSEHGSKLATVIVGHKDEGARTFAIHNDLLCSVSKYFDGALNDGFKESGSTIELPDDCPFAFEVLYQWLYTGEVMPSASWYSDDKIPAELLWLRLYKLADCRLVKSLMDVANGRLRTVFAANNIILPTTDFLLELYDETGPEYLQTYVAFHTAFHIHRGRGLDDEARREFKETLNTNADFAAAVASRLMDMCHSSSYQRHPSTMRDFGDCK